MRGHREESVGTVGCGIEAVVEAHEVDLGALGGLREVDEHVRIEEDAARAVEREAHVERPSPSPPSLPKSRPIRSRMRLARSIPCGSGMMPAMVLAEFGSGQFLWSLFWFTIFFIWIWLLFTVFADIFRSHDLSGVMKAVWVIFVVLVPYFGVFVYLIARGGKMKSTTAQRSLAYGQTKNPYMETRSTSQADELQRLVDLRAAGVLTDRASKRPRRSCCAVMTKGRAPSPKRR